MLNNVYFIRHGKSSHNLGFDKKGEEAYIDIIHTDSNLVDKGFEQAENLKNKLNDVFENDYKNNNFIILVSPLRRCITTALLIFEDYNISKDHFVCIEELREFPCGLHTPNKRSDLNTLKYFYDDKINFDNIKTNADIYWNIEREEYLSELITRIKDFNKILEEYKKTYKNIYIVTHQSFMSQYLYGNTDCSIKHCELYPVYNIR